LGKNLATIGEKRTSFRFAQFVAAANLHMGEAPEAHRLLSCRRYRRFTHSILCMSIYAFVDRAAAAAFRREAAEHSLTLMNANLASLKPR
jgi:hypothetical protein